MKAKYIGKSFNPKLDLSDLVVEIEGYEPDPCNGKIYEIVAISPITCIHPMNEYAIVIKIYNLGKISWTTTGYKSLDNFIRDWEFNIDSSEQAVGQSPATLEMIENIGKKDLL